MNNVFLNNAWYAVAWSEEIGVQPFDITICGERLLLFRTENGDAVALSGICPHRFAVLAQGERLPGDQVQCPYHGLVFGADGRCTHNPHGPVPGVVRLASYIVEERDSVVWMWVGDADAADTALLPDFSVLVETPERRVVRGRLRTSAHFELITDNLMDLSHVGYLHKDGLGNEAIANGVHDVSVSGTTIQSNRWCPDGAPSPVWSMMYNGYRDNVDHWLDMRWDAPCNMLLDVGVTPTGQPRAAGAGIFGAHILAPETATSTHYIWAASRTFSLDDTQLDQGIAAAIARAFVDEDKPMLEDIQKTMGTRSFNEMRPLIMPFDKGAVFARRMLEDLRAGRKHQAPSAVA
jgi:phenylpropionate dioxygenase-like ring-hydroxylating dioxygenase large terminal subunit